LLQAPSASAQASNKTNRKPPRAWAIAEALRATNPRMIYSLALFTP